MATVHEWFAGVSSPSVRLAVTAAALLTLAVGWLVGRAVYRRTPGGVGGRAVTLLLVGSYLALCGGVAAAILSVWGFGDEASRFLGSETGRMVLFRTAITVVMLATAYVVVGVSRRVVDEFVESRLSLSTHEGEVLFRAVQLTLYAVVLLGVLSVWEVALTNLLISAGVLGVVLGLAAQQTLGAVISGFVIMLSRPFEVGDFVRVGDREGIVTDITLVATRLRTMDAEEVSIPNDVVESGEIVNYSRDGRLRVHAEVGVDYDADLDRAAEVALDAVAALDVTADHPDPDYDVSFDDSAMLLDVRFPIDDPTAERRWNAHREAVLAIRAALREADIRIPFPQRELSARGDDTAALAGDALGTDGTADTGDEPDSDGTDDGPDSDGTDTPATSDE